MFYLKLLAENDTKEKIKNLILTKIVHTIFFLSWFASDQGFLYARVLKLFIWIFCIHIGDCQIYCLCSFGIENNDQGYTTIKKKMNICFGIFTFGNKQNCNTWEKVKTRGYKKSLSIYKFWKRSSLGPKVLKRPVPGNVQIKTGGCQGWNSVNLKCFFVV